MERTYSHEALMDGVKDEGNVITAICAGVIAAIIGTLLWVGIMTMVGHEVSFTALGVAVVVGLAIRMAGNGSAIFYGLLGATLTLLSCVAGEVMATIQTATSNEFNFYTLVTHIDLNMLATNIMTHTTPLMYGVYAVSILIAYKLSRRKDLNA